MTVSWNNISFNSNTRAVLAATLASLGCGTLYVYSAYSTQLADRLGLSATESSVIGMCGSIGVSLLGVFAGVLVDHLGPVIPTLTGSLLLLIGYLIIFYCYYTSSRILLLLALGSCLAGFGSSMGYSSSMKTAALNFPHARGTATSFPISTFGLSAFFFSSLGAIFFSGNTSGLLLLLAFVTSSLCFFNAPFLQTPHTPHHPSAFQSYPSQVTADAGDATPTSRDGTITPVTGSNGIATYGSTAPSPRFLPSDYAGPHRDRLYSQHSLATLNEQLSALSEGSGRPNITTSASSATLVATAGAATAAAAAAAASAASPGPAAVLKGASGGNSILVGSTDIENQRQLPPIMAAHHQQHHHHHHDESHSVWGWELVKRKEFWAQFLVLGGLAGSCQMYIYCVGYIVRALAMASQENSDALTEQAIASLEGKMQAIQSLQVSIISLSSFAGRIVSGIMSDVLNQRLELQRLWMIFSAAVLAILVQGFIAFVPMYTTSFVWIFSGMVGFSYGLTFGVYPTIVADTFGMHRYSQNWGMVCVSPVFGVYFFNVLFGKIYDSHSVTLPDSKAHVCYLGSECYSRSFVYSLFTSVVSLFAVIWMIWTREHQHPSRIAKPSSASGTAQYSALNNSKFEDEEEADEAEILTRSCMIP